MKKSRPKLRMGGSRPPLKTSSRIPVPAGRLLDWIYPRRCIFCDGLLTGREQGVCTRCRKQMPLPFDGPRCMCCSKPLTSGEKEYCGDCVRERRFFVRGLGIFLYQEPLKSSLMGLKFHGRKEYAPYLGKLMAVYGSDFIKQIRPDVVIPVPVHKKKAARRGYNQAELLAQFISSGYSIPLRTDLVLRKKSTKAQKELDPKARKKNLSHAFFVMPEISKFRRILIVDDIYTTGATVNVISGKMKEAGAGEIFFLTLCIGQGF